MPKINANQLRNVAFLNISGEMTEPATAKFIRAIHPDYNRQVTIQIKSDYLPGYDFEAEEGNATCWEGATTRWKLGKLHPDYRNWHNNPQLQEPPLLESRNHPAFHVKPRLTLSEVTEFGIPNMAIQRIDE